MIFQIKVAPVMDSFKLAPPKRRFVFYVRCKPRIMRALMRLVIPKPKTVHTQRFVPPHALLFPIVKPFVIPRFYEIFKLHLFKLAASKREVSRGNFISE